jgi:hypothetical protein
MLSMNTQNNYTHIGFFVAHPVKITLLKITQILDAQRARERERARQMLHLIRLSTATNKQRLWYMIEMSVQSNITEQGKTEEKTLSRVPLGPSEIPHGLA